MIIFVMTRCYADIRAYHLPEDERMRFVLNDVRGFLYNKVTKNHAGIITHVACTLNTSKLLGQLYMFLVVFTLSNIHTRFYKKESIILFHL